MKIKNLIILVMILLFSITAVSAIITPGVSPAKLEYINVLKGSSLEKQLRITNFNNQEMDCTITVDGNEKDWFTLSQTTVKIPAKGSAAITVSINIPDDAASGVYDSNLIYIMPVTSASGGGTGATMNVVGGSAVKTEIKVTGEQIIDGNVFKLLVRDTEIDEPVTFIIGYANTGNVVSGPTLNIQIKRDNSVVGTLTEELEKIKPGTSKEVTVLWDTKGQKIDSYKADAKVMLNGKILEEKTLSFKILPYGSLQRSGTLKSLELLSEPSLNEMLKVEAIFQNTGKLAVNSKFKGEVYFNNKFVDIIESDEKMVSIHNQASLISYFKPTEQGSYKIKGKASYGGKETAEKELSFTVGKAAVQGDSNFLVGVVIIMGIIIVGFIVYFFIFSKK